MVYQEHLSIFCNRWHAGVHVSNYIQVKEINVRYSDLLATLVGLECEL
jgi:hypothetical protein